MHQSGVVPHLLRLIGSEDEAVQVGAKPSPGRNQTQKGTKSNQCREKKPLRNQAKPL